MNRRLVTAMAAGMLLLFVAGCGKNADPGTTNKNAASNAASSSSGSKSNGSGSSSSSAGSGSSATSGGSGSGSSSSASSGNGSSTSKSQPPQVEKVNVGPLKVGEAAKVGPLTVTIKKIETVNQAAGLQPGYIHTLVEIDIQNSSDPYTINVTDHFRMETPEGKKANYSMQATGTKSPRLQGNAETGKNITGWLGYLSKGMVGKYKYQYIHPDFGIATWEFSTQ